MSLPLTTMNAFCYGIGPFSSKAAFGIPFLPPGELLGEEAALAVAGVALAEVFVHLK